MSVTPSSAVVGERQDPAVHGLGQGPIRQRPGRAPSWSASGGGTHQRLRPLHAGSAPGGPYTITASSNAFIATASVTVSGPTITKTRRRAQSRRGTTTDLTASATDNGYSTATLTYTWAQSGRPARRTFNANGTNAAQSSTATFTQAGSYTFYVSRRIRAAASP